MLERDRRENGVHDQRASSLALTYETAQDLPATARHPRFDRPYTELAYQPMLELLGYLRAEGFKTFIVSGGGVEFIRVSWR